MTDPHYSPSAKTNSPRDSGAGAVRQEGLLDSLSHQTLVWAAVTLSVLVSEADRWFDPERRRAALSGNLFEASGSVGALLPILLAAPLFWWAGRRRQRSTIVQTTAAGRRGGPAVTWCCSFLVAATAFFASRVYGRPCEGLPPGIHDEFSYLFQAQTLLHGRFWFPSFREMPGLFDQMHVLNEGHFASRYYPGAGLWIAPFLALGNPWLGYWIANALVAGGVVWIGRELSGLAVGMTAGLLCAVSPGLIVFSNMLLAHHPTLVGLTLFQWAILAARTRPSIRLAFVAGCGLSFAMLCRPLTAAAIGFPFGIDWLIRCLKRSLPAAGTGMPDDNSHLAAPRPTLRQTLALAAPLVAGMVVMLAYNQAVTGRALRSPYQEYTAIYTPRHVFGFGNVTWGEQHSGLKVLENYDRWAVNLTPRLAAENVAIRLTESTRWTLGLIPLLFAAIAVLLDWKRLSIAWKLVLGSIASLHIAHIPYWFDGILHWHYVFESAPLLLLLFAEGTRRLFGAWRQWSARGLMAWWGAILAVSISMNLLTVEPLWRSLLNAAQAEAAFPRRLFAVFRAEAASRAARGPIIVFVVPDESDRHVDYVTNPPTLDGPVLVARESPGKTDLQRALALFPERHPYEFRAATREWRDLQTAPATGTDNSSRAGVSSSPP